MGGGCNRISGRETFYVGSYCENNCFQSYGGCEAGFEGLVTKTHDSCELKPETKLQEPVNIDIVNFVVAKATKEGKSIFLYTPDMFSSYYLKNCFRLMLDKPQAYISINACVRTLIDSGVSFAEIRSKGIQEIWLGVESGSKGLRDRYNKLPFTNDELEQITRQADKAGVHVCWYLVDGEIDTVETRMETYALIKNAGPFRVHIGELRAYQ